MKGKPFTHNDQSYDLSHRHPFELELIQPAQPDKPKKHFNLQSDFFAALFHHRHKARLGGGMNSWLAPRPFDVHKTHTLSKA